MSNPKYDSLSSLKSGRYDYVIKVRIIRLWRGATKTGEPFKAFNIMLIDNKKTRIQALIPGACADELQKDIKVGAICSITKFSVQMYKTTDRFRCLRNDKQLVFSSDTKVEDVDENNTLIPEEMFDFYDHSELLEMSKQTTYLTDVVGIIKRHDKFRELKNKHGQGQTQAKFTITDGSSNVKVTFWDQFGEMFQKAMMQTVDKPVIIIIAACRVSFWKEDVDISNVYATKFYLNYYKHNSVIQLRKMLGNPEFYNQVLANQRRKPKELLNLEAIKKLGKEYIENQVLTHVTIKEVDETKKWCFLACTNCETEVDTVEGNYFCTNSTCNSIVPHPDIKFKLSVVGSDNTGGIEINLGDREVRTLTGTRARKVLKEENGTEFPQCLKNIAKKDYTIQLLIKEMNVVDHIQVYTATNICSNFIMPEEDSTQTNDYMQQSNTQASTSSYGIQGLSELNCESTQH